MSTWALYRKDLRWGIRIAVIITLFASALSLTVPFMFGKLMEVIKQGIIPTDFMASLERQKDYGYFLWYNWFGKNLYQFGFMFSLIVGGGMISGEVSRNTAGFLFTKPFTRAQILQSKYVTGAMVLFIITMVSTLGLLPGSYFLGYQVEAARYLMGAVLTFLGLLVTYSVAVMFSTLTERPVKSYGGAFVMSVLLALPGWLGYSKWSLFYVMQGWPIFLGQGFPWLSAGVMMLLSAMFYFLANKFLDARDL